MRALRSQRYELYRKRFLPWQTWFAWRPVRTISGRRVWWTTVYRKIGNTYTDYDNWTWYYYADEFDLLKCEAMISDWESQGIK